MARANTLTFGICVALLASLARGLGAQASAGCACPSVRLTQAVTFTVPERSAMTIARGVPARRAFAHEATIHEARGPRGAARATLPPLAIGEATIAASFETPDGEALPLGVRVDATVLAHRADVLVADGFAVEQRGAALSLPAFLRVANAARVELRAGDRSAWLDDAQLEALRDVASRLLPPPMVATSR